MYFGKTKCLILLFGAVISPNLPIHAMDMENTNSNSNVSAPPVNFAEKYSGTRHPLHKAALGNDSSALEYFLQAGMNANMETPRGTKDQSGGITPIQVAARYGNIDAMQTLLRHGANIHTISEQGHTPFSMAVTENQPEAIDLLARQPGVDVNQKDSVNGHTELHVASMLGHEAAVRALLRNGADRDVRTTSGKTPLDLAKTDQIRQLLQSKPVTAGN